MILLIGILSAINILFYLILAFGWRKVSFKKGSDNAKGFSVVVPVRNEELNVVSVLRDLERQEFPKDRFEVLVVDDFSEDGTMAAVEQFRASTKLDLKILASQDTHQGGKKHALTRGIQEAKHEIILTTDGDCSMGENWIKSYASVFSNGVQAVAGPVALQGKGMLAALQKIEFAGLMAFGGATLSANNPSMCSGANFGFKKEAFERVGGYSDNIEIPSGDDEFLLYSIIKESPRSGRFLKSRDAIVQTKALQSFGSFFQQRARWVSKWKHNKNWKLRMMAVLFFIDYALFAYAGIASILGTFPIEFFLVLFSLRLLANYTFLKPASRFLGYGNAEGVFILLQIFYPFHVLLMGVVSIFGRYTWKGRKYHG